MKTKAILFLSAVAIVTLSFTFVNSSDKLETKAETSQAIQSEPIGGFAADEIVK